MTAAIHRKSVDASGTLCSGSRPKCERAPPRSPNGGRPETLHSSQRQWSFRRICGWLGPGIGCSKSELQRKPISTSAFAISGTSRPGLLGDVKAGEAAGMIRNEGFDLWDSQGGGVLFAPEGAKVLALRRELSATISNFGAGRRLTLHRLPPGQGYLSIYFARFGCFARGAGGHQQPPDRFSRTTGMVGPICRDPPGPDPLTALRD